MKTRSTERRRDADAAAVPIASLAKLLSAVSGEKVTPSMIRADVKRGAPATPGGKVNLLHYAAWLVQELSQ
ncbi:MAG: hypothetical protein GY778_13490 [bacterium]|nr:hypothetical protein [bacterium]